MRTLPVGVIVLILACSASRNTDSIGVPAPPDFYIRLGEGGGFTGLWSGFEVDSTGHVTGLSGRTLGATRKPIGTMPSETLSALWARVETSGIMESAHASTSGNITRSLTVTARGKFAQVSWSPSIPPSTPLDTLYNDLSALIKKSVSQQ